MSNFKVGQKVVCIENYYEIVKGEIYEIYHIVNCSCGALGLNVGVHRTGGTCTVCHCMKIHSETDIFSSKRFRPLDYDFVEEVIKLVEPVKEVV